MRGVRKRRAPNLAAALVMTLAGCAAAPPERYMLLDTVGVDTAGAMPPSAAHPALAGDLQILPFQARGVLADRHLVYLDGGDARPSASLQWEEAPAIAVPRVLARVLQAERPANAVLAAATPGLAGFWLAGEIERFELISASAGADLAIAQINFTLLAGPLRRPALIARHCRAVPAGASPAAAFSAAVTAIGTALVADITAHAPTLNMTTLNMTTSTAPAAGDRGGAILIGQNLAPTPASPAGCNA